MVGKTTKITKDLVFWGMRNKRDHRQDSQNDVIGNIAGHGGGCEYMHKT